jgi:hypothetical protein
MTYREYDKKMMNFCPGLKYWHLVLDNYHELERQKPLLDSSGLPTYVNGVKQMVDHYTTDEQEEFRMTEGQDSSKHVCTREWTRNRNI